MHALREERHVSTSGSGTVAALNISTGGVPKHRVDHVEVTVAIEVRNHRGGPAGKTWGGAGGPQERRCRIGVDLPAGGRRFRRANPDLGL